MGEDCGPYVACGVSESGESGAKRLIRFDLESGKAVIEEPGQSLREIVGVGHRCPILSRVEEHDAIAVFDDVGVYRPRLSPRARSQEPEKHWSPGRRHVVRSNVDAPGAYDGHPANEVIVIHDLLPSQYGLVVELDDRLRF